MYSIKRPTPNSKQAVGEKVFGTWHYYVLDGL